MIKLNNAGGPYGDGTTSYNVETDVANVGAFIQEVLKEYPQDWGHFRIRTNNTDKRDICVCSYSYGKIERKASNYDTYGTAKIKSIFANGGWSAMNYDITVEDFDTLPEQEKEEFQITYWGWVLK